MRRGGFPQMGGMNINKLLKDAQAMQKDLQKSQEEILNKDFEAQNAGGAIKAVVGGNKKLKELKISNELLKDEDADSETISDLILVCVNEAISKVEAEEKKLTDGLNLSGFGF